MSERYCPSCHRLLPWDIIRRCTACYMTVPATTPYGTPCACGKGTIEQHLLTCGDVPDDYARNTVDNYAVTTCNQWWEIEAKENERCQNEEASRSGPR